ncbi:DUF4407 domain-containing protein [Anditalea andensis]|uniref:DUF4407 domain-containing protein n=1 Tax=Anditalea andensis TaxID=1048983 RepID=A0A074KVI4_9BACT|nr:DUF4407 domain-containing protein [Anditalea andensis]KEO72250.1 hypothetical protein EL17_18800 [Anditalea andensis]
MKALGEKYQHNNMRKPSGLQNFFILCSGADKEIIIDCPTEWNKFAGIGATIFLTACLALLSGAYAMHFVFENAIVSILFGVFWAIVIFNLDRYIVLSLRKEKIPTQTDIKRETNPNKKNELISERSRLFWNQVYMASPRFIIALIIALTVSKPIELRLFQNRIDKELENTVKTEDSNFDIEETKRIEDLNNQLSGINKQEEEDKSAIFSNNPIYQDAKIKIPKLENDIKTKEQTITANTKIIDANRYKETRYKTKVDQITNETEKIPYTVWLPNATAVAKSNENKALVAEIQKLNTELSEQKGKQSTAEIQLSQSAISVSTKYESAKNNITQQIENLNKTYLQRKSDWVNANKRSSDLPARLEALGSISSFGNSIWWASLVITLLFIVLETAPVVIKLLTKRGPYDEKLDAIEYQIYIDESKKVDMLNREINEYMRLANDAAKLNGSIRLDAEKDKLEVELRNNKELLNKLADYQRDLANIYADAWYQEEKAKALIQAKGMYNQANPIPTNTVIDQPKIEESFWKQNGSPDKIEYFFRNGSLTDNELLYFENDQMNKGKWNYNSLKDEVEIDLLGNKVNYSISELTKDKLKLTDKLNNCILEFEKV